MCAVGKGVWEGVVGGGDNRGGRGVRVGYGWQEGRWEGARVFVAPSTSGLAAGMAMSEKERMWRELGEWVGGRREEEGGWSLDGWMDGTREGERK